MCDKHDNGQPHNHQIDLKELMHAAIEKNNPDALFALGEYYEQKKDRENAFNYYLKAAEQDHAGAHNNIGIIYCLQGNIEKAKEHLHRAADVHNIVPAILNLALLYDSQKDRETTKKYLHLAADSHDVAHAQFLLGLMYTQEGNLDLTKKYWHRAADEHRIIGAQINLGYIYCEFNDYEKALSYYNNARAHKDITHEATAHLDKLKQLIDERKATVQAN
jgi:tetratricopeptide (TPR) repeat protein